MRLERRGSGTAAALLLVAGMALAPGSIAQAQGVAVATAEQVTTIDRRVATLESQMRAVQREVFKDGSGRMLAADTPTAVAPAPPTVGTPATEPLVELQTRVEALEAQQRALTGQVEELQFRVRQMETLLEKVRGDTEFRLNALEGGKAPEIARPPAPEAPSPRPQAGRPAEAPAPAPAASPGAPATPEAAYQAAYASYKAQDWPKAVTELTAFAGAYPKSPRASNATYWAGRAEMAQGRHPEAAKLFLSGYKSWPQGAMAPSSLLWLGKALIAMKQPKAACEALDQLRAAYPDRLTGQLLTESEATRAQAKCGA
jgi:tol-pal system protein YbgF